MAKDDNPKTVDDATRFTSNTPMFAKSKGGSSMPPQQQQSTNSRTPPSAGRPPISNQRPGLPSRGRMTPIGAPGGNMPSHSNARPETLDEKVARLRAAHLAAQRHELSRMDRFIIASRPILDAAHKYTVLTLIGFSALSALVTVYAVFDMMRFNRKRRQEFYALQQQLQVDSLEAARFAYMKGTATEEQIAMVEEASERAKAAGTTLPSLLGPPRAVGAQAQAQALEEEQRQRAHLSASFDDDDDDDDDEEDHDPKKKPGFFRRWFLSGLKEEDSAAAGSMGGFRGEAAAAASEAGDSIREKAKAAFEAEKENQRKGGPLDQLGIKPEGGETKKKGWGWW